MVMGAGHPYYRTDASKIENPTNNDFGYVGGTRAVTICRTSLRNRLILIWQLRQ